MVDKNSAIAFFWMQSGYEFAGREVHTPEPRDSVERICDILIDTYGTCSDVPGAVIDRYQLPSGRNPIALFLIGAAYDGAEDPRPEALDQESIASAVWHTQEYRANRRGLLDLTMRIARERRAVLASDNVTEIKR